MNTILSTCPLFNGLNPKEIEHLLISITHQKKKYSQNESISISGSEVHGLFVLINGSVRGEMVDYSGKTIKIEDIESPGMLAPAFLFGRNNKFPVDIIANDDVELIFFHKMAFLQIMQLNQKVLMNYLNIISDRAQFLSKKIKFLTFQTIKGKFANYILTQSKLNIDNVIILSLSQIKLADLFGVTRPALGKAIRELHNDKIIDAEGKRITILNRNRLFELMK